MPKVVINRCYGGFSLSDKAILLMREWGNKYALKNVMSGEYYPDGSGPAEPFLKDCNYCAYIPRDDPDLVKVVEQLGNDANGEFSELRVVDVPDGISWYIHDYDGMERVDEEHASWP
jgi:hypothetical protein